MGLPSDSLQLLLWAGVLLKLLFLGGLWPPGFRDDTQETATSSPCSKDDIIDTADLQQHWKGRQRAEGNP